MLNTEAKREHSARFSKLPTVNDLQRVDHESKHEAVSRGIEANQNLTLVAISLGVSLGAGALACAIPAIMAARVEPATALRR